MQFSEKRNLTRWIIIISSFLIASLILWNTYVFFQTFIYLILDDTIKRLMIIYTDAMGQNIILVITFLFFSHQGSNRLLHLFSNTFFSGQMLLNFSV